MQNQREHRQMCGVKGIAEPAEPLGVRALTALIKPDEQQRDQRKALPRNFKRKPAQRYGNLEAAQQHYI